MSLQDAILKIVQSTHCEPLETEEIINRLHDVKIPDVTRAKVIYRLNNLRADGLIHGKMFGAGNGIWAWWSKE